jgi:hypothetical protein
VRAIKGPPSVRCGSIASGKQKICRVSRVCALRAGGELRCWYWLLGWCFVRLCHAMRYRAVSRVHNGAYPGAVVRGALVQEDLPSFKCMGYIL